MNPEQNHPAEFIAHWPSGPVACCLEHANQIVKLAEFLGSHVAISRSLDDTSQRPNCISESNADKTIKTKNES